MKVEDPNALRFILQDDVYLLEADKLNYNSIPTPQPEIETPPVNFNYLGSNKKNFLILVHYARHEIIAEEHLSALESVLNRIGHNREDVAILNTAKNIAEYEPLNTHFMPRTLLILGQESVPAGMKEPPFNLPEKHGDVDVLFTFSFDAMMTNTDNKKAFWEQMKML